jgi:hypothetical protein
VTFLTPSSTQDRGAVAELQRMLENLSPKVAAAGLTLEHVLCPPDRYAGSQPRGPLVGAMPAMAIHGL